MPPELKKHPYPRFLVSADWSKEPGKRAVYVADLREHRIFREARSDWRFDSLMALAEELSAEGSVLVGVDVVLGVPRSYWNLVHDDSRCGQPSSFVDWLGRLGCNQEFFDPANTAENHEQWRVDLPWFHVPKGKGTLNAFKEGADDGFLRLIDRSTGAKPLFAVSGIPGTVGSGTRDFWQELAVALAGERSFAIWPFEGPLSRMLNTGGVVLAETYPGLAYGAALAEALPTARVRVTKTGKKHQRHHACDALVRTDWAKACELDLGGLAAARRNDDDFDALMTAAAVLRCGLDDIPLVDPQWIDPVAEGSMLLAGPVDPTRRSKAVPQLGKAAQVTFDLLPTVAREAEPDPSEPRQRATGGKATYTCPIPGCSKVFSDSRGGWDAHVASLRKHADWYPDIKSPQVRKELFKRDFGGWFGWGV